MWQHEFANLSSDIFGTFEILNVVQEVYYFFDIVCNESLVSIYLNDLGDFDVLFELFKWQDEWLFVQEVLFEDRCD